MLEGLEITPSLWHKHLLWRAIRGDLPPPPGPMTWAGKFASRWFVVSYIPELAGQPEAHYVTVLWRP
jgi:hypothetical protein